MHWKSIVTDPMPRSKAMMHTFLEEVYRLAATNDIEGTTDYIFDQIDKLLCNGDFAVCDGILKNLDVERIPTTIMRSFLTITATAKTNLPSRGVLYQNIEHKMTVLKGEEKTRRIIGSLA